MAEDAWCVCELADILELPQSTLSSHLQVIRQAGLLESERCGKWVYYRVAPGFRDLLATVAASFAEELEADRTLRRDRSRAAKRMATRPDSCCPGPRRLATIPSLSKP